MPIPSYEDLMLPLLKLSGDGQEHSLREAADVLAQQFGLTEAERKRLLPSGQQTVFDNRVGWASTYLKKAKFIEPTKRAFFKITARGLETLAKSPKHLKNHDLTIYPEFFEFVEGKGTRTKHAELSDDGANDDKTPLEMMEDGYQQTRHELARDLLSRIKTSSPSFFERLVVDLLVKIGYGGSRVDAGEAIGKSGDGGIDGIIREDRLGLDVIYLQAKRWDGTVGRPEIQKFVGALHGRQASKGIFITTGSFSNDARDYVNKIASKVVLVDGQQLAQLMIDHNVGVAVTAIYEVKKIDSDYFTDG